MSDVFSPEFKNPDTDKNYTPELFADFHNFIKQGMGRPGRVELAKNHPEALTIIASAVSKLSTISIQEFSRALAYLCDINQSSAFDEIEHPKEPEFIAVRNKIINFLLERVPASEAEAEKYIEIYQLLGIKKSFLMRQYEIINYTDEGSYLRKLPIEKILSYIKKKVRKVR